MQAATAEVATSKAQITAAEATVQSAKAALETARINLGFTHLTSPIDGIPGIAEQQVGSLVSPSSPVITTVSTVDPIKVYFTVSEQEYLDFHRRYSTPDTLDAERKQLRLELILADGTQYPQPGTFYFADRQVDIRTGAIRVAGLFPNPGDTLWSIRQGPFFHSHPRRSGAGATTRRHGVAGELSDRRGESR